MLNSIPRTTATVQPMNQAVSPPSNTGSTALSAAGQSSFAAALRKLAKQAGDPSGEHATCSIQILLGPWGCVSLP